MTCTRQTISGWEAFSYSVVGTAREATALATSSASATPAASFYPNPVLDHLTYALPQGLRAHSLVLSDATGRTVLARTYGSTGPENTLDTSGLASGLYLVRLAGADFTQSFKFRKQ